LVTTIKRFNRNAVQLRDGMTPGAPDAGMTAACRDFAIVDVREVRYELESEKHELEAIAKAFR